ncbi:MAG TPA: zf-HC2 domain-containing protein [Thermoanaerobaculia bacterium]|jgi:anti-sigma factor RsiW|nr:zf-HC2 domain-containing protein [Thermoanaerobaculia bacterium]
MSGHISLESLSAYLDGETAPSETRRLEAHLAACAPCSSRLEATRRVVGGLRFLRPAPPPPDLPARLEDRIAVERADAGARRGGLDGLSSLRSLRSVRSWLWWQGLPPLHGSFSAARPLVTAGLALLVAMLLLQNGESGVGLVSPAPKLPHAGPEFLVSEAFGEAPQVLPQTTSEVAGRVFVWSDDVWVQRGVDAGPAGQPRAVAARSPAGRAMLAKLSDLDVLLADGSRVVLRYNTETVELWNGS